MVEWLLSPIDPSRPHFLNVIEAYHGRLMFVSWVILVPLGILIARFFKVTLHQDFPSILDNLFWWRCHIWLHSVAALLTAMAMLLVSYRLRKAFQFDTLHHWLGWIVICLIVLQVSSGFLRGTKGGPTSPDKDNRLTGDHFDMTLRRRVFEYFHKTVGYLLLITANIAIVTGLWQVNAPHWMWFMFSVWWSVILISVIFLQINKLNVDTYQAIWGPDPNLKGNQVKPIGWKTSRWSDETKTFE